jgi:hypothetical protein
VTRTMHTFILLAGVHMNGVLCLAVAGLLLSRQVSCADSVILYNRAVASRLAPSWRAHTDQRQYQNNAAKLSGAAACNNRKA